MPRLTETDLKDIGSALYYHDRHLIQFDNFLLVAAERDFVQFRTVPDRLIEQNMPDSNLEIDEDELEDEDEDEDVANEDIEV